MGKSIISGVGWIALGHPICGIPGVYDWDVGRRSVGLVDGFRVRWRVQVGFLGIR